MSSVFPFLAGMNPYIPQLFLYTAPVFFPKHTKRKYWMTSKKGRFGNGRKKHNRNH